MYMRVQEVILINGSKKYLLVDNKGIPIIPVAKYLKYLDTSGRSKNTLKTYCYCLKLYFEYLEQIDIDYREINFSILSNFVGWLRNPFSENNIVVIREISAKRTEKTINLIIIVVTSFYDYLFRTGEMENDLVEKLMKQIYVNGYTKHKSFLHHAVSKRTSKKNILKLKEPRQKLKVLTPEQVELIYASTTNIRDRFLIKLLYETGLRIGEALSLFIEDFIFDHKNGHKLQLINRGEHSNGGSLKTGERKIDISQELMDLFDDYEYEVLDELEIDSNFVFVKIRGQNKGQPLTYSDVDAMFKRIKKKTGIDVHAHLFRHTHATIYYAQTKNIKYVQERLGHSCVQTTMNIYMHPSDEEKRKSWEAAQYAFKLNEGDNK